ncbi:unnamed protein product [Blepharisma stoltei]|uniref:Serine/threonine-protein phosphatase n=1 Tax=Blepharisma stoltei TaxID=1481888 RepID=A0AAU9K639_9CILI|nr:unnamed protein product [Blepharisma stoltei]
MEPLIDPLHDRAIGDVPAPPHRPLDRNILYPNGIISPPDWRILRSHLYSEGRVNKAECLLLIHQTTEVFRKERNLLELKDPVTVVGDIHGQFYDFMRILELGGDFDKTKYLFLGDYVDRGAFSIEVVMLLYAIKLNYPGTVYMIRGNHECRQMTAFFNFRTECLNKFDLETYDAVMESFDALPTACLVNNKFLAIHGGISPELVTIEDISRLSRFQEPPRQGLYCDLLWSDPIDNDTGHCTDKYKINDVRGCSVYFGQVAVNTFLKRNRLLSVLRAHEAQVDGYKMHRWNGNTEFPVVITVFSAPNYCDVYNNKAAMLKFENNTLNIQQFNYTEHPYILPNFLDVFTWSAPFVIEKVLEMLHNIIKSRKDEPEENIDPTSGERVKELKDNLRDSKLEKLRNKVKAVSRMMKMFRTLREDKEIILQLKGLCPDNKVPRGLLAQGRDAIAGAVDSFTHAKQMDIVNEKRPD